MQDFIICLVCIALLLFMLKGRGRGSRARDDQARYSSGAEYDPVHYQVLRENVLNDE
jgi:hypothetical protein